MTEEVVLLQVKLKKYNENKCQSLASSVFAFQV